MMNSARTDGALLAGVCSGIAQTFKWNVWALRAVFLAFLLIKTLWAVVAYGALAVLFHLKDGYGPGCRRKREGLASPELSARDERIADLERRFRELEGQD